MEIDDHWYAPQDPNMGRYVKQLLVIQEQQRDEIVTLQLQQKELVTMVQQQHDLIKQLIQMEQERKEEVKQKYVELDLKKINESLHQLRVLREREINVLIREHIPFRFMGTRIPKSPIL